MRLIFTAIIKTYGHFHTKKWLEHILKVEKTQILPGTLAWNCPYIFYMEYMEFYMEYTLTAPFIIAAMTW